MKGHPVPKQKARANDLLRRRDSLRKARQLWIAGLVIWGVVVGWVIFGFVNSVTDDVDVRLTWMITWLLPVLVLAAGTLMTHLRVRGCDADLVEIERNR
jgi:hypothetical protein